MMVMLVAMIYATLFAVMMFSLAVSVFFSMVHFI